MDSIKDAISYDIFDKVDIRVGTVLSCESVEKSDKLYKLQVDFGPLGQRQILTAMQKFYTVEDFVGLQTLFVVNLEPRKMMGLESQGMIFAVGQDHSQKPNLLRLSFPAQNGDGAC